MAQCRMPVEFYRKAFRINEKVDLLYRTKRVPHNVYKLKQQGGKNIAKRVDEAKVRSIDVDKLLESFLNAEAHAPDPNNPDQQHDDMVTIKFQNFRFGCGYDKEPKTNFGFNAFTKRHMDAYI